ncbi:hypothetical protein [Planctomicrobium piriforme]|uniref:Uncharacterized protein n=1 Tax=Planctomicrobium piriforme TaxID=1576369 RepID=A0A1I3M6U0_9PLAN|nr:hypothetical protein [Planctomicrobium piriforme]SFI92754.1 hypothetical protein SAMN05421753_113179 [Planctomicrobium piriforme]
MLIIGPRTLPRTELTYIAFRLACLDTRERLELALQLDVCPERNFGFLTEVPFLRSVPAQVQMDLLMETWAKHLTPVPQPADLLDESILYSSCEAAARLIRTEADVARRFLCRGPVECTTPIDKKLADNLQKLQTTFVQEGLFLLLSQFQDIPPLEAVPLKAQHGLTPESCECLFDVLGRWYVTNEILPRSNGLLTRVETEQLASLLNAARCSQHPI